MNRDRKNILVLGGGGFIGSHMVKQLKEEGHWVRVCDLKYPEFEESPADHFVIGDLRDQKVCDELFDPQFQFDEVYQFAADMGGAGYIFTGENDANVMHNSALINLNIAERCHKYNVGRVFYSSSACMYPEHNQLDPDNPKCSEDSAYPADPDSEYGWEKLFSERLYLAFNRNYDMNVRVARYHKLVVKKKLQQQCVERLLKRKMEILSKYGVMDYRHDHSFILMSALKPLFVSCDLTGLVL
mgnify:CR=1 FL=1